MFPPSLQEVNRLSAVLASQEPFDAHKYAYIANVCVSKYARRQKIASNMVYLATDMATSECMIFNSLLILAMINVNLSFPYQSVILVNIDFGSNFDLTGMKQLFVHVNVDNKPAQELYKKAGFKVRT